jgi:DNA-binding NarL/FixJ family response regulator
MTPARARHSVMLLDEDALLREGVTALLGEETDLEVVVAAADLALDGSESSKSLDLAVVSSGLNGGLFAPVCIELARRCRVLVLSKEAHERTLMRALEAGAVGVVTTESPYDEFVETVRAALRGEACVPRGMLGGLLRELIDRRRRDEEVHARYARLTPREREVLNLLAGGVDVEGMASSLYISPQTVRSHLQRVLDKLEVHSRAEAVSLLLDHELEDATPVEVREQT